MLLKLLAWRKIPLPTNIGVVLVEQEVAGDEKSAVEVVVSRNRQLMDVRREREELRDGGGEQDEVDSNHGGRLADLYEQLQMLDSDTAELEASKILQGLGFTEEMQRHQPGRSVVVGG